VALVRLLVVEGEEDKKFFEAVFRSIGKADQVVIRHRPSGKSNAISLFGANLDLLNLASKARIGLVVDADDPALNASDGFPNTRQTVNLQLQQRSFNSFATGAGTTGLIATANHLDHVVTGMWVMPDNNANGYLEDFANTVVASSEQAQQAFALGQSRAVLTGSHGGPTFAFKAHHLPKAAVGTWLAWSDPPRMNLGTAVSRGLLDVQHPAFCSLIAWLNLLYFEEK
jgi:hypothetical protein